MRLVDDDLADQKILEDIIEEAKPPVPANARHLHWLLATPFRYAPAIGGSRFPARGDPGVYYGALQLRTACAEAGFWKWHFVRDSTGLTRLVAHSMSLFPASVKGRAWNLTRPPRSRNSKAWTHPTDYAQTQTLGSRARGEAIQVLVYESVRDPQRGDYIAVLDPAALVNGDPLARAQSWYLTVRERGVIWQRDGRHDFQFDFRLFEA